MVGGRNEGSVMDFNAILRVALKALARNKMRTTLTMLGIIIGVGAVICTVAIGEGASNQVQEQLSNLGDNLIFVMAGSVNSHGIHMGSQATKTLTVEDAQAIRQIPFVKLASPEVETSAQVVYQDQNWYTQIRGNAPSYIVIRKWPVIEGQPFSQHDVESAADVCLLGRTVVQNLFVDGQSPIGKTIRINNLPFLVEGILEPKGQSPWGHDEDDTIMAPYTTVMKKLLGINWIQFMDISANSMQSIPSAEQQVEALLRQRHHLRPDEDDDFIIRSTLQFAQAREQSARVLTLLLASIASVALLVGGIGIMNIMLVSVTERTREIGVRMAVGATESDVQMQFLSEAVVLSLIGGAVGVIVGVFGSMAVSRLLHWPTLVPPAAIAIAVVFSAAVGVFFGYYPARQAAHLDPIEALRYE
jgi:putative ABC transport system permease protein